MLPMDDHGHEPESPRVLPDVPNSTGPTDMYHSPVQHFAPSMQKQQQQQPQLQQLQQPQDSIDEHEDDDDQLEEQDDEKECLSVEDPRPPEQTAPEEKSNLARMRWHKAYNKIVHQLNVSTFDTLFFGFFFFFLVFCVLGFKRITTDPLYRCFCYHGMNDIQQR